MKKHKSNYSSQNESKISLGEYALHVISQIDGGASLRFFPSDTLSALTRTSSTFRRVMSHELVSRAAQLVQHVVLGEQHEAEELIRHCPELLFYKAEVTDYSGRTIFGTAFQVAIGAGDKPMWDMILPYFIGLEKGEALRQFNEQFPNGIKDDASEIKTLVEYYDTIALAIIHNQDHGLSVIEQFRKDITNRQKITQGKHFNLQHLIAVYQSYVNHEDTFSSWENITIFWQKVIGYVQRQVTAYDASMHCSEIQSNFTIETLMNEEGFERRFLLSRDHDFFPLLPDSGLGFNFACDVFCAPHTAPDPLYPWKDVSRRIDIWAEELYNAKADALADLEEFLILESNSSIDYNTYISKRSQ